MFGKRILGLILLIWTTASPAQDASRVWLGILRADGVLAPIALYDHGTWRKPWPGELGTEDELTQPPGLPPFKFVRHELEAVRRASLVQVPKEWLGGAEAIPREWYLWGAGEPAPIVRVTEAVQYTSHCVYNWGLLTEGGQVQLRASWPMTKKGFVSSVPLAVSPARLDAESPEARAAIAAVRPHFEAAEDKEIRELITRGFVSGDRIPYGPPISSEARNRGAFRILNVSRLADRKRTEAIYHIELERRYPQPPGTQVQAWCDAVTVFTAIVRKQGNAYIPISTEAVLTDCDKKVAGYSPPGFVFSLGERSYAVTEGYGWEGEAYSVSELTDQGLKQVLIQGGGGC